MLKLKDLVPLNLASEKAKFFASGLNYNPQFVYEKEIRKEELINYGKPKLFYLFLARFLLKKHQHNLVKQMTSNAESIKYLTTEEVRDHLIKHLAQYNLDQKYQIIFSNNFVSRVSVNLKTKEIKIASPTKITNQEMIGILAHEIDTHVLRQHNYEQQSWYKKKKSYGLANHLRTEEGLAIINEMIAKDQKIAFKTIINYLATNLALKKSFKIVFNFLAQSMTDQERAWSWTLKKKRGLKDTGQKGAFTKDLVYFEGLIEILKYLQKNNCDPSKLYYGKIDARDVEKVEKLGLNKEILLPKLFSDNPDLYKARLKAIIQSHLFL